MKKDVRILVVGAGPTGLTAALELARRGIIAKIVERRREPSGLSRAVGILPSSLEVLKPSGVSAALRAEGIMIEAGNFHYGKRRIATIPFRSKTDPELGILALAQDRTEAHLKAAFEKLGGEISYGQSVTALNQTDDSVRVEYAGGGTEKFDHVIGADGIDSVVRSEIGLPYEGFDEPDKWSIAEVECPDWTYPRQAAFFLMDQGNIAIVIPLEAERYRVISNTQNALRDLPVPIHVTEIHREGVFTVSVRQVPRYDVGRVFLAGDAAHCHSPVGGRGMNLGISDAARLAHDLTVGRSQDYSAVRHAEGARAIRDSERPRKALTSPNPVARWAAVGGLRLVGRLGFLQTRFLRVLTDS